VNAFDPYLSKAKEALAGAESELAAGRYNNAAGRAYYAAFQAAISALIRESLIRTAWTHEEVQALFAGQLINRRKLYPAELRSVLPELLFIRITADYRPNAVSRAVAGQTLRRARRFLETVLR
jgi:uncharacterized protein (UPF0332 family)